MKLSFVVATAIGTIAGLIQLFLGADDRLYAGTAVAIGVVYLLSPVFDAFGCSLTIPWLCEEACPRPVCLCQCPPSICLCQWAPTATLATPTPKAPAAAVTVTVTETETVTINGGCLWREPACLPQGTTHFQQHI